MTPGEEVPPESPLSWREAFFASPGPRTAKQAAFLAAKGVCMGAADTVPGVSGGTIALITGIYENLLAAVKSANTKMMGRLLRLDGKGALAEFHLRFLLVLSCGIAAAVVSLARLMNHLIHHHPQMTASLFFGLIVASIWVVGRKAGRWGPAEAASFFIAAAAAYYIVSLVPAETPESSGFIFLSGMIAICAMILPGLSGAFILLILGKYEFITATLKNPLDPGNMGIILVFAAGCLLGLAGFSRVLKHFLDTWHSQTLAFLTGLMTGSLRKIWPWKEAMEKRMVGGELRVIEEQNILPAAVDGDVLMALALMGIGFAAVMGLEKLSGAKAGGRGY
jgi:putative membrane protein